MRHFTAEDNRRLARSALAALLLHAVVLIILTIVIASNGAPTAERLGLITLNLESGAAPAPRARENDPAAKAETQAPAPSPSAPARVQAEKTIPPKDNPAVRDNAAAKRVTAAPEKDGIIREPAAKQSAAPPSRLEEGSLSRLDAMLKEGASARAGTTDNGGGRDGGRGGPSSSTRWDDNAVRALLFQAAPVIPRWVSEQGLRLKVELSVELNADGLVLVRGVAVSSGYPDVDAAVAKAVSRWKYTRGTGARSVRGVISYFIMPR